MKRTSLERFLLTFVAVSAVCLAGAEEAVDFVVPADASPTPTVVTAVDSTKYRNMYIHSDLTLLGNGTQQSLLTVTGAVYAVGSEPDEYANFVLTNGVRIISSGISGASMVFGENGGRGGRLEITGLASYDSPTGSSAYWNIGARYLVVRLCKDADPVVDENGEVDWIRLGKNGVLCCSCISQQKVGTTAVVRFDGGYVNAPNCWEDNPYAVAGGATLILRSVNGNPINNYSSTSGRSTALLSGNDVLKTEGDGDFVMYGSCNNWLTNPSMYNQRGRFAIPANIQWGHRGDFVIRYEAGVTVNAANALPYGPETGLVRFVPNNSGLLAYLNLNGNEVSVNGATSEGSGAMYGIVTNTSGTRATLVIGRGDTDGRYSAFAHGNLDVLKTGSGQLTLEGGELPNFTATSGVLRCTGDVTVMGAVRLENVNLTIGEVDFRCASFAMTNGTLRMTSAAKGLVCDGPVLLGDDVTVIREYDAPSSLCFAPTVNTIAAGRVVVDSTNTVTVGGANDFANLAVTVSNGTLRLGGAASTDGWWRFTFKKAQIESRTISDAGRPYTADITLALGKLALLDETGTFLNVGSAFKKGFAEKDLPEKSVTTSYNGYLVEPGGSTLAQGAQWGAPSKMMSSADLATYWDNTVWSNRVLRADESGSWITVTIRLPAGKRVCGYLFTTATNNGADGLLPKDWSLESSADGVNWTRQDDRAGYVKRTTTAKKWENDGVPFLCTNCAAHADWAFRPGRLAVANGATVDNAAIPDENVEIGVLDVDLTAGAGSIAKFRPSPNGRLFLTRPKATDMKADTLKNNLVLPLSVGEFIDAGNFASWQVYLDGELQSTSSVGVQDGRLVVRTPHGLTLVIR